jgi:hypothetical protein
VWSVSNIFMNEIPDFSFPLGSKNITTSFTTFVIIMMSEKNCTITLFVNLSYEMLYLNRIFHGNIIQVEIRSVCRFAGMDCFK